jgi:hypothetical protein
MIGCYSFSFLFRVFIDQATTSAGTRIAKQPGDWCYQGLYTTKWPRSAGDPFPGVSAARQYCVQLDWRDGGKAPGSESLRRDQGNIYIYIYIYISFSGIYDKIQLP